jgi:hypothetical protein
MLNWRTIAYEIFNMATSYPLFSKINSLQNVLQVGEIEGMQKSSSSAGKPLGKDVLAVRPIGATETWGRALPRQIVREEAVADLGAKHGGFIEFLNCSHRD